MGEITEEEMNQGNNSKTRYSRRSNQYGKTQKEDNSSINNCNSNDCEKKKIERSDMVEISLKIIGPSPPSHLLVSSPMKVRDLRKLIAASNHLPIENLRLIFRGSVLDDVSHEDDVQLRLNNGDSLIVAVKPKRPAKYLQDGFDDDEMKFQLPQSTSLWKKKFYYFLRDKLKIHDIILIAIFSLSLKAWAMIILWFIFAPVAHRWDLGPLYILGTGFCIIFLNLGKRDASDLSAYSIFNEDFRELPGTLNADRLDRDIRAGQL